jgi:hypothetical protein
MRHHGVPRCSIVLQEAQLYIYRTDIDAERPFFSLKAIHADTPPAL